MDPLDAYAEALADGRPIDWAAAIRDAVTPDDRERIEALRDLSELRAVFSVADQPPPDAPSPRQVLAPGIEWGGLRIVEHIGRGRFGEVYRAWDPALERHVALKLIHDEAHAADTHVIDEGRLMARVRHPNVVAIYGAQRIDGVTGLWMELIEGRTLETELAERGPFGPVELARIAVDLASALAAVHHAGLVHRDVKATNVMRESGGRVVLGDFGTGLGPRDSAGDRAGLVGTPAYLAPEIFEGKGATPQSDLYSLGVLLFHLATAGYPVAGRTLRDLRAAHSDTAGRQEPALPRALPRRLSRTIARLLHPDPARRFTDAHAAAASLKARVGPREIAVGLAGVAVAVAVWAVATRRPPARGANGSSGVVLEQLAPDLQKTFILRGASPDGRFVACHSFQGQSLAICDLVTGTPKILKPAVNGEFTLTGRSKFLSPNGRHLAFVWVVPKAGSHIRVIGVNGSYERELARDTTETTVSLMNWTADSTALVAVERSRATREARVLLVPIDASAPTELARFGAADTSFELSPDRRLVAFAQRMGPGDNDLVIFDLSTGRETSRLSGAYDDQHPLWFLGGGGLVFVSNRDTGHSLMSVSVTRDGLAAEPKPAQAFGRDLVRPHAFAPDGSLYLVRTPPARTVFLADVDLERGTTNSLGPLELQAPGDTLGGDWSADGRIAYLRTRSAGAPDQPGVIVIRPSEGGAGVREIPLPGWLTQVVPQLRWSPDATRLAVLYTPSGSTTDDAIAIVDSRVGGKPQEIVRAMRISSPRWDPAGNSVLYRRESIIYRYSVATATTSEVYRPAGRLLSGPAGFDISGSGTMAVIEYEPKVDGCVLRLVTPTGAPADRWRFRDECRSVGWAQDGTRIIVSTFSRDQVATLWNVPVRDGEPTRLPLEAVLFHNFSFSPDGRRLAYTTGNPPPNLWRLSGIGAK